MLDGWTLNVLGPVELRCGTTVLAVSGGRARTLLLCLLANDGRVPSEALVEALWGPSPPPGARATLKSHAAHLRAVLRQSGADLHGHRGAYELALGPVKLDVTTFELLCAEARRLEPADALRHLERALALWRGAAFADARDEPFAIATVARLDELRLQAVEMAFAAKLALSRHDEVITDIGSLVRDHPLRETLRGQLMLALYRSGRQADALRAYGELRTTLRDELGVDPSPELQQLELAILSQRADLTAPVRSEERRTAAPLPAPVGPLIGRVADIADVVDSLEDRRLVILTGPGGIGKTRLAIAAASDVTGRDRGEVAFVDLGAARSEAAVGPLVAFAVAGPAADGPGDPVERLAAWLGTEEVLLVVDGCEHVARAAGEVVERLLIRCPRLRVLATSREPLGVPGEMAWTVPPLRVRASHASDEAAPPASLLFAERATAVRPSFRLRPDNERAVQRICTYLDGLPLAIELAAASAAHLAPEQIADRLDEELFLADRTRRPARHRTLGATVAWSVDLLNDWERRLFERLSVFAGEFSLDAVLEVCVDGPAEHATALDTLGALVRKSLVVSRDQGTTSSYRLLHTLRRFGADALANNGHTEVRRARHADCYVALTERAEQQMSGADEAVWLSELEDALGNLRTALRWLIDGGRAVDALRMAAALRRFWRGRGLVTEGRQWLREALAATGDHEDRTSAKALHVAGWLAREQGDYAEAREVLEQSLRIYRSLDDPGGTGWALVDLAFLARYEGDYEEATALLHESLPLLEQGAQTEGMAAALGNLGLIARDKGDVATAEQQLRRSLTLFGDLGDRVGWAWVKTALGMTARAAGRARDARAHLEDALSTWQYLDDRQNVANVTSVLATIARERGDLDTAAVLLRQSLTIQRDLGDRRGMAFTLEGAAALLVRQNRAEAAAVVTGAAAALREAIRAPAPPSWRAELEAILDGAGTGLDPSARHIALAAGRAMQLADVIALAMCLDEDSVGNRDGRV